MRKGITILLLFCLAFQCFLQLGVVTWFRINKEYIVKNLCENRDKPQMKCDGKCYLRKQLSKTQQTPVDGKPLPAKQIKVQIAQYIIPSQFSIKMNTFTGTGINNPVYQNLYNHDYIIPVFHPPTLIS